jgi:hypothetical protein
MGIASSSASTTTTAPGYYNTYLNDLATQGQAAVNAATGPTGAGTLASAPTANQTAAYTNVGANVGNYLPGLTTAGTTTGLAGGLNMASAANPYLGVPGVSQSAQDYLKAGTTGADQIVGNYMSPYMTNVMDSIRNANQQNIQQNLAPGLTAASVGAGQFGSQRGANALAMGISNADIGAAKEQSAALQSGYAQALAAAQAQRQNQLAAGASQIQGGTAAANAAAQTGQNYLNTGKQQADLATQLQTSGLADTNALATLGGQQQTVALNAANYPMTMLGEQAKLMSGQAIPMSTTQTSTASPLSVIAGLGTMGAGLFSAPAGGTSAVQGLTNWLNRGSTSGTFDYGDLGRPAAEDFVDARLPSDRRLKTDIEPVGRMDNGLTVYRYRYKAGGPVHIGVMADEVEKIRPDAYVKGGAGGGFDAVNYSKL